MIEYLVVSIELTGNDGQQNETKTKILHVTSYQVSRRVPSPLLVGISCRVTVLLLVETFLTLMENLSYKLLVRTRDLDAAKTDAG